MLRATISSLIAMLRTWSGLNSQLQWVRTLCNDLVILYHALPYVFECMPSPSTQPDKWFALAEDFPSEWSCIVDKYSEVRDDVQLLVTSLYLLTLHHQSLQQHDRLVYVCAMCVSTVFEIAKQLGMHIRIKHHVLPLL